MIKILVRCFSNLCSSYSSTAKDQTTLREPSIHKELTTTTKELKCNSTKNASTPSCPAQRRLSLIKIGKTGTTTLCSMFLRVLYLNGLRLLHAAKFVDHILWKMPQGVGKTKIKPVILLYIFGLLWKRCNCFIGLQILFSYLKMVNNKSTF